MKLTEQKLREIIKKEIIKEAGAIGGYQATDLDLGVPSGINTGKKGDNKEFYQGFSSKEAKIAMDKSLKSYSLLLRKAQGKIIKDWMSKAKSGVMDYFDIVRGLQTGDASRAYPYETQFLMSILNKDKIIDRFRSYFKGKKGKKR